MATSFSAHGSEIILHEDFVSVNDNRIIYHDIVRKAREINPLPKKPLSYVSIRAYGHKIDLFPDTGNVWVSSLNPTMEFTLVHGISDQARQLVELEMDAWQDNIDLAEMVSFKEEMLKELK